MMRRSLHLIAPTLIALGLFPAAAWSASSATERDAQLEAVKTLIEREYRLPAQRQLADFIKAGYPDASLHAKFLGWFYAERFRSLSPDKVEQAKLTAEAKSLLAELDAAKKANQLPPELLKELSGSGPVIRLVNDLLRVIGQDNAASQLGASAIVPERRAALNATVTALIAATTASFDESVKLVKAHAKIEEDAWALEDKDPKFLKAAQEGVELRLEAVRPAYYAHKVLREVVERGEEFGIDPAPAKAFIQEFAKKNFKLLQEWDYTWGDYHPMLRSQTLDIAAQAARFKIREAVVDDLATDISRVLELDVAREFRDPAVADEIRTLQVKTYGALIAWYRELGTDVAPKYFQNGLDVFQQFKEKAKNSPHFSLTHKNTERASELARLYFQAGRLLLAKKDPAAAGVFGMVASARSNPLAGNAAAWMNSGTKVEIGSGAWYAQPVAEDPATAVLTAGALLKAANANSDPLMQRSSLISAAVALRNGVLGLNSAAFSENADEVAPELWFRYAECMSKLGMRWHAALVAQAGLRHLAGRMAEQKATSPWKAKDGKWTPSGRFISPLARNAVTYASSLLAAGRSAAITAIYDDSITLVNKVSPTDGGQALDRIQVVIAIQDKEFSRAMGLIDAYVKKYPSEFYDGASLRSQVYIGMYDAAKSPSERKSIADKALAEAELVAKQADEELKTVKEAARKRVLNTAKRDVQSLRAFLALREGKFEVVIDMLGPDYWNNPPADEGKSVQMLGYLCQAMRQSYEAQVKDEKQRADPQTLVKAWPLIEQTYAIWRKQKERLPGSEEKITKQGMQIAWLFQVASRQSRAMQAAPNPPAMLGEIDSVSNRAFADLIEPTLHAGSDGNTLLGVGNVLWDLDEHERAVRLYELYMGKVAGDPELAALRDNPKDSLAALDTALAARPELRAKWTVLKDLLIDDPELTQKIIEQDLPEDQWGEKKRDFVRALEAIRGLRAEVATGKMAMGAAFQPIDEGLTKLDSQVSQLGREISVTAKLALAYRELGKKDKANALYEKLINFDPTNPEFLAAAVELTLDAIRGGNPPSEDVIKLTRIKAARVRDAAQNGSPTYWTAVIQVMELSIALKDVALVNNRLKFDAVNQSTPADDLQLQPRNRRDDKRVRRARNPMTVDLCKRYLSIFSQPGVSAKASFTIVDSELDGKPVTIFVPVDAPQFAGVKRDLDDGTVTWFFWEEGKEAPPEPAEPPAAAPPAAATPAAPAPKPEAKP
jgi:tetratricopeptide (TPR) repeat protein